MSGQLPTDPLDALGDSTFLVVLSYLLPSTLATVTAVCRSWRNHSFAHRQGIWRDAYRRSGGTARMIYIHDRLASNVGRPHDFKGDCISEELLRRNKRKGRSRDVWLHRGHLPGKFWQFRVGFPELLVCSSQDGSLQSIDSYAGFAAFAIPPVRKLAHVELCHGHVIVDPYEGQDTMQVYRTHWAIQDSTRKYSPATSLPVTATASFSLLGEWSPDSILAPEHARKTAAEGRRPPGDMPRDALAFDREITPPTHCSVFRGGEDGRGTMDEGSRQGERAILGAAGEEGVYIWRLEEDDIGPDEYRFPTEARVGVKSLEMDDRYIFVGGVQQLHILNRQTKEYSAFPPLSPTLKEMCGAVYTLGSAEAVPVGPLPPRLRVIEESSFVQHPSPNTISAMGRIDVPGFTSRAPRYSEAWAGGKEAGSTRWSTVGPTEEAVAITNARGYIACRYTTNDLVCATRTGHLLITRDYASILVIPDPLYRQTEWARHTILIDFGKKIRLLDTDGDFISVSTTKRIFFLHTSTLPSFPLLPDCASSGELPPIRLHTPLDISSREVETATCVQIHRDKVYYSYMATGVGRPALLPSQVSPGGERANLTGPGPWIRGWDFSVKENYRSWEYELPRDEAGNTIWGDEEEDAEE